MMGGDWFQDTNSGLRVDGPVCVLSDPDLHPSWYFHLLYNTSCYIICSGCPKQMLAALQSRFIITMCILPCHQRITPASGATAKDVTKFQLPGGRESKTYSVS